MPLIIQSLRGLSISFNNRQWCCAEMMGLGIGDDDIMWASASVSSKFRGPGIEPAFRERYLITCPSKKTGLNPWWEDPWLWNHYNFDLIKVLKIQISARFKACQLKGPSDLGDRKELVSFSWEINQHYQSHWNALPSWDLGTSVVIRES